MPPRRTRFGRRSPEYRPETVLDIGCNTGHFSLLAADAGANVVAVDRDPDAAGSLWRNASRLGRPVLPLVVDITRPPGAAGVGQRGMSVVPGTRGGPL